LWAYSDHNMHMMDTFNIELSEPHQVKGVSFV